MPARACSISPAVGTSAEPFTPYVCHRLERWIALAHWKNALSTLISMTQRGGRPCISKRRNRSSSIRMRVAVDAHRFADAGDEEE